MKEQLYSYKCIECGQLHHPRHFVCKKCGALEFEEIPLEGECTLITWTRSYNLPEGYMKPYLMFAIAKFPNGIVASGQLETDNPQLGMKLMATVDVVKEGIGRDYYGFIFKAWPP